MYWWESQADRIEGTVNEILRVLHRIEREVLVAYEAELTAAEAAAKANSDAEDSAATLLKTLSDLVAALKAAGTDPATAKRITDLAAALQARADALAASVVANTPAA